MFQKAVGLDGRVYTGSLNWTSEGNPQDKPLDRDLFTILHSSSLAEPTEQGLPDNVILLPIVGSIAAGLPTEEQEHLEGQYPLPKSSSVEEGDYLLRIRGDSMVDAHILDGDLVHVRKTRDGNNGDIVVALVDGENTVKYLSKRGGRVSLLPANPAYSEIVPTDELIIQGRVVGVIRQSIN
jgi:repressor LexA